MDGLDWIFVNDGSIGWSKWKRVMEADDDSPNLNPIHCHSYINHNPLRLYNFKLQPCFLAVKVSFLKQIYSKITYFIQLSSLTPNLLELSILKMTKKKFLILNLEFLRFVHSKNGSYPLWIQKVLSQFLADISIFSITNGIV